jgi:hypothetical protein
MFVASIVMDIVGKTKLWAGALYIFVLGLFSLWLGMFLSLHLFLNPN